MPKNKNAFERYRVIDDCLSNQFREYTVYDLMQKCREKLGIDVSRRTVLADIKYIEEEWADYGIEILHLRNNKNQVYFRYKDITKTIRNSWLSHAEAEQLRETIELLGRFKGSPQFEWIDEITARLEDHFNLTNNHQGVIGLEQNIDIQGIKFLNPLFGYIVNKQCIEVQYRKFNGEERVWNLHPYYIKQYNQRWFLLGSDNQYENLATIPLDRIISLKPIDMPYKASQINFDEYFDNVIGVTIPKDREVEEILLQFSPFRFPYVRSKPLHWSQKIKDKEECIISIKVIPNKELVSQIFSFGPDVEVLAPQSLREEIMQQVRLLTEKYSECK